LILFLQPNDRANDTPGFACKSCDNAAAILRVELQGGMDINNSILSGFFQGKIHRRSFAAFSIASSPAGSSATGRNECRKLSSSLMIASKR
jgi:hypothetical protein